MTSSKLGTDNETGQIVELSQASRRQGLYIIGANGTGKTGLIEHLILQDIDQGLGVGLLDPHGDLVNAILAKMAKREDDVILLDIQDEDHPFGLNIFECPNPQSNTAVQKIVDLVMHIFEKLYDVSRQTPRMAQFLRNCTHTLVANPGYTMADIPLLLQDEQCRSKLVAQVTDPQVLLFWKTYNALRPSEQFDRAESTINKMDELLQPLPRNIVGQGKTTVNIQQVMDDRRILLVKLSAQLDQVTSLVGTLFIALFLNAAYSRASLPVNKRKQFNLYADEFQRFATEDFATLLTEARKFGIATTIAHQARYQPGMTDGIRAVSLQAANHVVFRVTSPDADELAGGFDITPQAAWEQEVEKESFERVEEEVIDGEEEIKTPVSKIRDWVISGKTHPNPKVNQFFRNYPNYIHKGRRIGSSLRFLALSFLDDFLYQVMREKNPLLPIPKEAINIPDYYKLSDDRILYILSKPIRSNTNLQQYLDWLRLQLCTSLDIHQMYQACASVFASEQEMYEERLKYYENKREQHRLIKQGIIPGHVHVAYGGDYTKATDQDLQRLALDEVKKIQEAIHEALYVLEQFFNDLREVMTILAVAPILEGSGIRQPRKRKQINYHTHPRKVIMHPQRAYQDVKNDIANQLSGLQNFIARVKLSEILSHNPGKKCLNCKQQSKSGNKFCSKCGKELPNEYTFTTLKPLGGLGKTALQQRLTTIQANNIQQRYVRDRTKVEAEIINRQQSCSGSAPAQPQPQPQQSPRHARQVPVQGKCKNCGASNSPGAKFCNQCGKLL